MGNKNGNKNMVVVFAKAQMTAYIITAAIFMLCVLLLTYTDMKENTVPVFSAVCTLLSAFVSGFMVSSKAERRGMLWGMLSGLSYAAVVSAVLYMAADNTSFDTGTFLCLLTAVFSGSAGGVLGINGKK